ncbi:uncharacterized protein BX663DRAFT_515194 [Cokeromyces recurvatus]|uniref:uncharacterized protein n=1 Tax=Cokeromyces recurvatus TaxID=90255 RepID=UPI00221F5E80|nr:uncharacterized protein BX663DRAFT_515194 [Cokeromyces recurvatus]KAI7901183.1 hypothetical protein BX663DRAFT_515194 [Cokeromyces recurvatus]
MKIPIIDFADYNTNSKEIVQKVFDACKSIGFFYIINHGFSQNDIDKAFELSKQFFDLPKEEKEKYSINQENHGYFKLYSETLDPQHQKQGDHKEGFNFVGDFTSIKLMESLPQVFENHIEFLEQFSRNCHQLALQILEIFAIALEIPIEEGGTYFFSNKHTYHHCPHTLRFLKYPSSRHKDEEPVVYAGAHSDYGSITLLFQKDVPGLEVWGEEDQEWVKAPIIKEAIMINVGDQMELWTNGLFKSSQHRVVFLPEHHHVDRYSIPYFVHSHDNVVLSPLPSPCVDQTTQDPITAGELLRNRLDGTYEHRNRVAKDHSKYET